MKAGAFLLSALLVAGGLSASAETPSESVTVALCSYVLEDCTGAASCGLSPAGLQSHLATCTLHARLRIARPSGT